MNDDILDRADAAGVSALCVGHFPKSSGDRSMDTQKTRSYTNLHD